MFTTLTVINARARRRFLSEENMYRGYAFYTTRLFSKKKDNRKRLSKFEARAAMPVLSENSEIVCRYRFITLVNALLEKGCFKKIGIADKDGFLPFLLPFLSEKCGVISVFTEKSENYISVCDEIYGDFGTPTIVLNTKRDILSSDIIFSADGEIEGAHCKVYSAENTQNATLTLPLDCPDYCSPFIIAAGLYFYGGFHEFSRLKAVL